MWKLVASLGLFDILKSAGKWLLNFGLGQLVMKAGIFMAFNIINALIVTWITGKSGFSADGVFLNPLTIAGTIIAAFNTVTDPNIAWALSYFELPLMVTWCTQAYLSSFLVNMWVNNMRAAAAAGR